MKTKYLFSNSKIVYRCVLSLLNFDMAYSVKNIWILGEWEVWFSCWHVELTNKSLLDNSKNCIKVFFSLCWLVEMTYSVWSFRILGEWVKCWIGQKILFQQLKKVYICVFFLCWLVDMAYSVLNLWISGEGVVWFCRWLVELRKKYYFSNSKNSI